MAKTRYAIGVDLGGTSIKIGVITEKGKIAKKLSLLTKAEGGPAKVIGQIKKGIRQIYKSSPRKIEGIGIGSPGSVILKKGTVENPPNFPGWGKVTLGSIIKKEFKKNVFVENDANAAAIGEMIFGAGMKLENFIMITLGTGVGGGIIINRNIFRGETGAAGELGHVTIDYKGEACKCGSFGCIEAYAGNNYLINHVKLILDSHKDSALFKLHFKENNVLSPKLIHEAALLGDEFANEIINDLGLKIGYALTSIINVLDISNIIVGGGVSGFGNLLLEPVKFAIKERVMEPIKERVNVKAAKLKNDAGIKGASALVFYRS